MNDLGKFLLGIPFLIFIMLTFVFDHLARFMLTLMLVTFFIFLAWLMGSTVVALFELARELRRQG
jgi:hypothetical protein